MDLKFLSDSELYEMSLASEPKHPGTLGPSHNTHALLVPRVTGRKREERGEERDDRNVAYCFILEIVADPVRPQLSPKYRAANRKSACWGVKVAD